jgi:hypothetical protein
MHGQSCDLSGETLTITTEYSEANKSVVREQLQKAAVRLADILDKALNTKAGEIGLLHPRQQ